MYCCMIVPDKGQNSTIIPVQLELCWDRIYIHMLLDSCART